MDKEFEDKCMKERMLKVAPTVTIIRQEEEIKSLANHHKNSSEYFLEGARSLLRSNTPLLAVLLGYFAMEHKSNQLLALKGYKVESHICTQIALSRIVNRKDLAKKVSVIFELRQNIGYRLFLKHNEEERKNAEEIINEDVIVFINEIDNLIREEQAHEEASKETSLKEI